MIPVTTDLINKRLKSLTLRGAIELPNRGGIGLVFDEGIVFAVRVGMLYDERESADALATVRRTLVREHAALETLHDLDEPSGTPAQRGKAILREEFGIEAPGMSFLPERTVAEQEGTLDADHARKRQQAHERAERLTPDVG